MPLPKNIQEGIDILKELWEEVDMTPLKQAKAIEVEIEKEKWLWKYMSTEEKTEYLEIIEKEYA